MHQHARDLEFEEAARLRDEIEALRRLGPRAAGQPAGRLKRGSLAARAPSFGIVRRPPAQGGYAGA